MYLLVSGRCIWGYQACEVHTTGTTCIPIHQSCRDSHGRWQVARLTYTLADLALHRSERELRVPRLGGFSRGEGGQKRQQIGPAGNDLLAVVGQLMGFLDLLKRLGDSPSIVRTLCVLSRARTNSRARYPGGKTEKNNKTGTQTNGAGN